MNQEDEQKQGSREVQPMQSKDHTERRAEEPLPLSQFIAQVNTQCGTDLDEDSTADFIMAIQERLKERKDLAACMLMMEPNDALPIFGQAVQETVQLVFEERHAFFTQLIKNKDLSNHLASKMFQRFQLLNTGQRKSGGNDV